MRKIVSYLVYSLDGVVDNPQEWVFDRFDEQMVDHLKALISTQDAVLLGRTTYEAWASYWPTSTHQPFASFINDTPKYVVTTTLREATWRNSTLLTGDVVDSVTTMKERAGADVGVHGSATLVRSLLGHGLLDELRLALFPVVAGKGDRLFEKFDSVQRLELVDVNRTDKGVLYLTYNPRPT